jgi:transposase
MAKKMDESTKRRVRAGRMLLTGKGPTEVAKEVGVARQTVHTWKDILDEGGIDALRAMGGKGRPAQLDERQLEVLRRTLLDRPTEHGFGTELWTLKRIRLLIERLFGVSYSEVHVWRIIGALGFSNQKPERRAIERDADAVEQFKHKTWPALKKKPSVKAA